MNICWNRYCVSFGYLVTTLIRFPSSWMISMACWSHALPDSIATGKKMFLSVMLEYLDVFMVAAWLAATPARLDVSPMCYWAKMLMTVTFHASAFPFAHRMIAATSGLLPSSRERLTVSSTAGILAFFIALQMMAFMCECPWCLAALFRQLRQCKPLAFTALPQGHVCGS